MPKNTYRLTRHGQELVTFTTNSGTEVIEYLEDFLYDGDNEIGHKFIVERVATMSQHEVHVSGVQGVQIGNNTTQTNTFVSTTQVTQNVKTENGNAYVSAGSQTVYNEPREDQEIWDKMGWPFNI